jgi:Flp pilus assembly protein TadD
MRHRFDDGIASSREALRLDPTNRMALHNLALALGQLGRFDEALAEARTGLKVDSKDASLQALELRLRLMRLRARVACAMRRLFW